MIMWSVEGGLKWLYFFFSLNKVIRAHPQQITWSCWYSIRLAVLSLRSSSHLHHFQGMFFLIIFSILLMTTYRLIIPMIGPSYNNGNDGNSGWETQDAWSASWVLSAFFFVFVFVLHTNALKGTSEWMPGRTGTHDSDRTSPPVSPPLLFAMTMSGGFLVTGFRDMMARDASRALVGTWFLFFIFSLLIFFSCNLVLWQQLGGQQRQQPRQRQWWGLR